MSLPCLYIPDNKVSVKKDILCLTCNCSKKLELVKDTEQLLRLKYNPKCYWLISFKFCYARVLFLIVVKISEIMFKDGSQYNCKIHVKMSILLIQRNSTNSKIIYCQQLRNQENPGFSTSPRTSTGCI